MSTAAETIFEVGKYYYDGKGDVPKNVARGMELIHEASNMGNSEATLWLGECHYRGGEGIATDKTKALQYFQEVVGTEDAPEDVKDKAYRELIRCYFELAKRYYLGDGVPQDKTKTAEYLHEIARMEDITADMKAIIYFKLAKCYHNGEGVAKNKSKAVELFQQVLEMPDANSGVKKEATKYLLTVKENEIRLANKKLNDVKSKLASKDNELREMKAAVAMTEMSKKRNADSLSASAAASSSSSKKSRNVCTIS